MSDIVLDASRGEHIRMSLDEFVAHVDAEVDIEDFESIKESAWALRALANDREFLLNAYNDELAAIVDGTSWNVLTPQTIILARRENFYIRSNIWLPPSESMQFRDREAKLTAYGLTHDHNFHFLTVGYYGAGYFTDVYRYDYKRIVGYIGEDAELEFVGHYQLTPGMVMAYEAGRDVHVQYEPDDIAISINLMTIPQSTYFQQQISFDLEQRRIAAGLTDSVGTRLFLLSFMKDNHDGRSIDLLARTVTDYPCLRTRSQALRLLGEIAPEVHGKLLPQVDGDVERLSRYELVHAGQARQIDAI
jgi:hypothetical protein